MNYEKAIQISREYTEKMKEIFLEYNAVMHKEFGDAFCEDSEEDYFMYRKLNPMFDVKKASENAFLCDPDGSDTLYKLPPIDGIEIYESTLRSKYG